MEEKPRYTPGPYEIRPVYGERDIEVYSSATGESVASIHAPGWEHENAPGHGTTLHNAALFRAAPRLRESLAGVLQSYEQMHPESAKSLRALLAEIDHGPGEVFLKQKEELERRYDDGLRAQADEMALQTKVPKPDPLEEHEEDHEEGGHSF